MIPGLVHSTIWSGPASVTGGLFILSNSSIKPGDIVADERAAESTLRKRLKKR
jgi:hypothetical protein